MQLQCMQCNGRQFEMACMKLAGEERRSIMIMCPQCQQPSVMELGEVVKACFNLAMMYGRTQDLLPLLSDEALQSLLGRLKDGDLPN